MLKALGVLFTLTAVLFALATPRVPAPMFIPGAQAEISAVNNASDFHGTEQDHAAPPMPNEAESKNGNSSLSFNMMEEEIESSHEIPGLKLSALLGTHRFVDHGPLFGQTVPPLLRPPKV